MAINPRKKPLRECARDQISVWVPAPLNSRLDALVETANAAGENTNRGELVSALILSAEEGGELLADRVRDYRRASAGDAIVTGFSEAYSLEPMKRSPGPRPRRGRE